MVSLVVRDCQVNNFWGRWVGKQTHSVHYQRNYRKPWLKIEAEEEKCTAELLLTSITVTACGATDTNFKTRHKLWSEGLSSHSWIVTASGEADDAAVMNNTCCFNWLELSVMNSSKTLNNHITHACNCTSAMWRRAPIIRVTIAAPQLCTRPHLHRNERKQQTNESWEEVRRMPANLLTTCFCVTLSLWLWGEEVADTREESFSPYRRNQKNAIVNI